MADDIHIVEKMILEIAEYFRYMSDNEERRLYYVNPIRRTYPYAYQHSSIRDVATICDILDLVHFFNERRMTLGLETQNLFAEVVGNTLQQYHELYHKNEYLNLPDGTIGDVGFFLLALEKCFTIFPTKLPEHWKTTRTQLIQLLLDRQNADGSIRIFFDSNLSEYEKSAEAFYLPEALIGLIATLGHNEESLDNLITTQVQKVINYCCQDEKRKQNIATDNVTFYTNWQFQLLSHWINKKLEVKSSASIEAEHIKKLINALMDSNIAKIHFGNNVATVEVACYLEGLVHARNSLHLLKIHSDSEDEWLDKETKRCIHFLYQLQTETLPTIKGGFVHARNSEEARIDVAGHVFGALEKL